MRQTSANAVPRAIQPTFVNDEMVVLGKASPVIRNTYEIRLALYMAVSRGLRFILGVPPGAQLDPQLSRLIGERGGVVEEVRMNDFSVYFGHESPSGEGDGWVLGDAAAWKSLKAAVRSEWLQQRLVPGYTFVDRELSPFAEALLAESISATNVDGEDVREALLLLAATARNDGGCVFIS